MITLQISSRLHKDIEAVCPITGIAVDEFGVSASVRFQATDVATKEQLEAAQAVVDSFDWSEDAQKVYEDVLQADVKKIAEEKSQMLAEMDAYAAIADKATIEEMRAEVKAGNDRQRKMVQALDQLIGFTWRSNG